MKKRILSVCLIIALLATVVTSATLAYLTDTDKAVNTFTVGNVRIDLTEAVVKKDVDPTSDTYGDMVAVDPEKNRNDVEGGDLESYNYGTLYPDQSIFKDPRIENLGTEDAFVAAKVTITSAGNLHSYTNAEKEVVYLLGVSDEYDNLDISKIISGELADLEVEQNFGYHGLSMVYNCADYAIYQEPNKAKNTYVLYFFIEKPLAQKGTVTLFDTISIPAEWTNDDMAQLKGLTIDVEAYAVQANGFADCYTAMTNAFKTEFNFS